MQPDTPVLLSELGRQLAKSLGPEASESEVRQRVFVGLERVVRHLERRDPKQLAKIYGKFGLFDSNQNAECRQERRLNFRQRRQEQHQICMRLLDHIKIPEGVATRSLLVPPPPARLFTDVWQSDSDLYGPHSSEGFQWLDTNASNAEECSRRAISREHIRRVLSNWIFLYFRIMRRNWESIVVTEKKVSMEVNMYSEDQINKWTLKLRFKMMRVAPVKVALLAFLSRMGLEANPGIIFCRDGFFGVGEIGTADGNPAGIPTSQLSFNSTPRFLNMRNGDNIYVSYCTKPQLEALEQQRLNFQAAEDTGVGESESGKENS